MGLTEKILDTYEKEDEKRIEEEAARLQWKKDIDYDYKLKLRVVYDSGTFFEFWVHDFLSDSKGIIWMPIKDELPHPQRINLDKVESIWTLEKQRIEK